MQLPVGFYSVQYCRMYADTPVQSFGFFSNEPSLGYFQRLTQMGLRAFWGPGIVPKKGRGQPIPEMVRVLNDAGGEICRWHLQDEFLQARAY
jgi:hypothetical protein